jgi:hypothetical protein
MITYIPLYIHPDKYLTRTRWELLPGLWFERISNTLKEQITKMDSSTFGTNSITYGDPSYVSRIHDHKYPKLTFDPNYAVRIHDRKYKKGLHKRLAEEGKAIPHISPHLDDEVFFDSIHLAKLILISLILQQNFIFTLGHPYHFFESRATSRKTYKHMRRWLIGGDYRTEEILPRVARALPVRETEKINRKKLARTISSLERYYRPFTWSHDRLSVALTSLWSALVNPYIEQTFLSFTIILEALLSTRSHEITHTLSERAAVLLGRTPEQRVDIYDKVNRLYNRRSSIVHGKGVPKKGKPKERLLISTKIIALPFTELVELTDLSLRIIDATINESELIYIIQSNKKESKIKKDLHSFYTRKLLCR